MSKTSKRKAGDSSKSNISSTSKDYQKRPSVFERLGTKASNISSTTTTLSVNVSNQDSFCRNWAQTGNCPYGKSCKLSNTHTLISPSKRGSKKEGESKQGRSDEKRIHSNLTRRVSPEVNWETWDQTDLEYEDEKALEKRRQLLQRELELQMKKETRKQDPAKRRCSSTSSCSSSSSGSTSSTGSSSESSVSTLRRNELKKKRQSTSSPSESERTLKKNMVKSVMHKDSPARKATGNKKLSPSRKPNRRKSPSPPSRKPLSPPKQKPTLSVSGGSGSSSRRRESPSSRRAASLERKSSSQHRSSSRNRRGRSPKSRPRPRTPESKPPRAAALPPPPSLITSRNRSSDRKKEDDRKGSKDDSGRRDRKSDFRDKRDQDEGRRSREKAREIREAAREKERLEALERCRERQREREQAKEKERAREERERERAKRDRERRDRRGTSRERRRPAGTEDKRHDRIYDRYERKVGERERSYERERARDRALERVMERKSADRNRDRSRESYDRSYETRRIIQEEKPYNSPFRGNDRGRSNYETERERERVGSQEIRTSTGYNSAGESERRSRRDRQTWDSSGGSYQDSQRDKRDWEQRDYHDSSREWDNRSRCRGDDGGDEWSTYNTSGGGGGGGGSDWHSGRSHLLPIPHHEERRTHHPNEISEKEHALNDTVKEKEQSDAIKRIGRGSGDEMEEVTKRPRVEEPPPLEEELSDISDDADDILNREDVEFEESVVMEERRTNSAVAEEESEPSVQEPQLNQPHEDSATAVGGTNGTGALTDDEHIDSLDFEEISDDELEEEAKVNKGSSVGDALGVDWASLMAECRPQRKQQASSAHTYWNTANILARIGVSFHMANPFVYNNIKQKYNLMLDKDQELTQVAGLQRALVDKKQRRATLVSSVLEHKQALSARSDISVRRQLCGLPVVSLESHQTAGFCQWAV
uniref:Putative transcription termination factor rho n=1 Tax=Panstrongylus megistus TaxID=65343 RepID=A0A069DXI5_9HEMI